MAHMHWSGWVGGDIFHIDFCALPQIGPTEFRFAAHNIGDNRLPHIGLQGDVYETGTCNTDRLNFQIGGMI